MNEKIYTEIIVFYVDDDEEDQLFFEAMLREIAPNSHLLIFNDGKDLLQAVLNPPPVPGLFLLIST